MGLPTAAVDELDGVAYLIGYPIAHSLSPVLHHTIYSSLSKKWEQFLYETKDLESAMTDIKSNPKLIGSGITMPYKVSVIPYLDELTADGKAIGAINTIFLDPAALRNGKRRYIGTNTDCTGIMSALAESVSDPEKAFKARPGLVVGGGGTCRAAVYALQKLLGCSPIYVVNRDKSEVDAVIAGCTEGFGAEIQHVQTVEEAMRLPTPGAIVNAIPDFEPITLEEKTVRMILEVFLDGKQKGSMLEMCYHPSPSTRIFILGAEKGWNMVPGTEAMIWQGVEQARLWSGLALENLPIVEAKHAVRQALEAKSKHA